MWIWEQELMDDGCMRNEGRERYLRKCKGKRVL